MDFIRLIGRLPARYVSMHACMLPSCSTLIQTLNIYSSLLVVKWTGIAGAVLGGYYFKEFIKYIPKKELYQQHITVLATIILMNTYIYYKFPKRKAAEIVGKEGVLLYIILFASPLCKLKNVIESKSAVSIPLPFTIASTLNCSLWTIVGMFLMNDFNVFFPAAMGLSSALAQLLLKGMYAREV